MAKNAFNTESCDLFSSQQTPTHTDLKSYVEHRFFCHPIYYVFKNLLVFFLLLTNVRFGFFLVTNLGSDLITSIVIFFVASLIHSDSM